jgi:sulfite exporter TauE/SafE
MNGIVLGLTSGTTCLMFCGPVLLPFLIGERKTTLKNYIFLGEFLLGRLVGYLLFGLFAWFAGRFLVDVSIYKELIYGFAIIILSIMLFFYSFIKTKRACAGSYFQKFISKFQIKENSYIPLLTGFFTGLNLCPQFLIAFVEASNMAHLFNSIFYFFLFFIGTSVWFIPFPIVGFLKNIKWMKYTGQILALVVAVYYLYLGIDKFVVYFTK